MFQIQDLDDTMGFPFPNFDDFPGNTSGSSTTTVTSRPPNWLSVFNTSAALASQIVGAFGRNPSTQIGSGGVFAIGVPQGGAFPYSGQSGVGNPYGGPSQGIGGSVGSTLGGGLDGVFNWMAANPLMVGGFALGAFLLFREPPRRR